MDFANLTFVGLMTLGFVNVVGFFKAGLDSRVKIALAMVFAFVMTFVPVQFANIILEKAKIAVEVALTSSGVYKIAQKAGGI